METGHRADPAGSAAAELWREELGASFGRLAPETVDGNREHGPRGTMRGTRLGALTAYRISGTPQVVRRTPAAVRREPVDLLKICVQLAGRATVHQGDREIRIAPGQMAVYDTGRPYDLLLEPDWSCAVLAFPRTALHLPEHTVLASLDRAYSLSQGPGAVLTDFIASVVRQNGALGPGACARMGEAGLHLVAGTLSDALPGFEADGEAAADAMRMRIFEYVRTHLAEPDLTHARVAAAHHMAARTLHRLFEDEPRSVSGCIRIWRLEGAMRELADPALAHRGIAVIAARWCFTEQAHFTRLFHAHYGMTPSAARRHSGIPARI